MNIKITDKNGTPSIDGIVCTYQTVKIRDEIEKLFETKKEFNLPSEYTYEIKPSDFWGQVAKIKHSDERRYNIYLYTPAEKAIYEACIETEKMGTDERLTKAIDKLLEARELIADVVDEKPNNKGLRLCIKCGENQYQKYERTHYPCTSCDENKNKWCPITEEYLTYNKKIFI